jgi:hypothetical protein
VEEAGGQEGVAAAQQLLGEDGVLRPAELAGLKPIRIGPSQQPGPLPHHHHQQEHPDSHYQEAAGAGGHHPPGAGAGPAGHDFGGSPYSTAYGRGVVTPLYRRQAAEQVLSVQVQRTGQLAPGTQLTNPVVRLHVVSAATGEYLRLSGAAADDGKMRHMVDPLLQAEVRAPAATLGCPMLLLNTAAV